MEKYIMVLGGDRPNTDGCKYISSVNKDGLHFSHYLEDAIVVDDSDQGVILGCALTRAFCTVDVYSVKEETVLSFKYVC